jgi:23S rRNA pseudouridine1911/1915/1917 synthase
MRWIVPSEAAGQRADKVLAHISGHSRSAVRQALETGTVTMGGAIVQPRFSVSPGDEFVGEFVDTHVPLQPEPVAFEVLFEDDGVAVVDKPAGVVTHPGAGRRTGTLAAGLLHRWPSIRGVGEEDRWGIVHRLDRDTSGLLAVALTEEAFIGLSAAIRQREVTREYLCLVEGSPASPTGTIDAPIGRDPRRPTRMSVDASGRQAVTHYRFEEEWGTGSFLRVTLQTGRTHQIRVHLASIGLPVAGDPTYGRGSNEHRLFLHSTRLAFQHPVTGVSVDEVSALPADLEALRPPSSDFGGV